MDLKIKGSTPSADSIRNDDAEKVSSERLVSSEQGKNLSLAGQGEAQKDQKAHFGPPGGGSPPPDGEASEEEFEENSRVKGLKKLKASAVKIANLLRGHIERFRKEHPRILYSSIAAVVFVLVALPILSFIGRTIYFSSVVSAGEEHYAAGEYQEALQKLDKAYGLSEGDSEIAYGLAKTHLQLGRHEEARAYFGELIEAGWAEDSPHFWFHYAVGDLIARDFSGMREKVLQALDLDRNYLPGHFLLGCVDRMGPGADDLSVVAYSFQEAVKYAESEPFQDATAAAVAEDIRLAWKACYGLAEGLVSATSYPLPFSEFKHVSSIDDKTGFAFPVSGFNNLYLIDARLSEVAREDLPLVDYFHLTDAIYSIARRNDVGAEASLSRVENKEGLLYGVAKGYMSVRKGDFDAAAAVYRDNLDRYGESEARLLTYANATWAASGGDFPEKQVIDSYEKILSINPRNIVAINNLAFLHIYQGKLEEASELLEEGIKIGPSDIHVVTNRSIMDIAAGDLESAEFNLYALAKGITSSPFIGEGLVRVLTAQNKIPEAIAVMRRLERQNSGSPDISLQLAQLFEKRNQPLLVISELVGARQRYPESQEVATALLFQYAKQGERENFLRLMEEIGSADDYRVVLGRALIGGGNDEEVMELFREAVAKAPTTSEKNKVLILWGRRLLNANLPAQRVADLLVEINQERFFPAIARSIYYRIQANNPNLDDSEKLQLLEDIKSLLSETSFLVSEAKVDLAWALFKLGDFDVAITIASAAVVSAADAKSPLLLLEAIYEEKGEVEKLEEVRKRVAVVDSGNEGGKAAAEKGSRERQGENKRRRSWIKGADEDLSKQLDEALKKDDLDVAIEIYTELLARKKTKTPALTYYNRGALYLKTSQFKEAVADFDEAIKLGGVNEKQYQAIYYNQAFALAKMSDYVRSESQVRKALEIAPNDGQMLFLLGSVQEKLQDFNGSAETYRRIISLNPGVVAAYVRLAQVHKAQRDPNKSIEVLRQGLAIKPKSPSLHQAIADSYVSIGDNQKAKEHLLIAKNLRQQQQ